MLTFCTKKARILVIRHISMSVIWFDTNAIPNSIFYLSRTHFRGIALMTTGVLGSLIWNLIVSIAFSPSVTL